MLYTVGVAFLARVIRHLQVTQFLLLYLNLIGRLCYEY